MLLDDGGDTAALEGGVGWSLVEGMHQRSW